MSIRWLLTVIFLTGTAGCELVSISEDVSYGAKDRVLPSQLVEQIEVGLTNRLWLERYLGPADTISDDEEFTTHTYRFSEQVQQRVRVFLLFQHRRTEMRDRSMYIELKDDVVQKVWFEGDDQTLLDALSPG